MDRQKIFNKVYTHLLKQNKQSALAPGELYSQCSYRMNDPDDPSRKLKCAVGCLIPSNRYSERMEGNDLLGLLVNYPTLKKLWGVRTSDDKGFLNQLQNIHDTEPSERWRESLEGFAEMYNLKVPDIGN